MRIDWRTHRTLLGLASFAAIGFIGGIFGLGAGFANVPALNLLMSAPAQGRRRLERAHHLGDQQLRGLGLHPPRRAAAAHRRAAILGVMLGSRIGARLLGSTPAAVVRRLVIVVMLIAGLRALAKGTGLWT